MREFLLTQRGAVGHWNSLRVHDAHTRERSRTYYGLPEAKVMQLFRSAVPHYEALYEPWFGCCFCGSNHLLPLRSVPVPTPFEMLANSMGSLYDLEFDVFHFCMISARIARGITVALVHNSTGSLILRLGPSAMDTPSRGRHKTLIQWFKDKKENFKEAVANIKERARSQSSRRRRPPPTEEPTYQARFHQEGTTLELAIDTTEASVGGTHRSLRSDSSASQAPDPPAQLARTVVDDNLPLSKQANDEVPSANPEPHLEISGTQEPVAEDHAEGQTPAIVITSDFDKSNVDASGELHCKQGEIPSCPVPPLDRPKPPPKTTDKKPSFPWYSAIKVTLAALERSSDVFTPLKSAVAALNVILEIKDAFVGNQQEFEKLSERLTLLNKILTSWDLETVPQDIKDRRESMERTINDLGKKLEEKTTRNPAERLASTKEDQAEIVGMVREINFAIELAMLDVSIRGETLILQVLRGINVLESHIIEERHQVQAGIEDIRKGISDLKNDGSLKDLFKSLADERVFAFSEGNKRQRCIPGSRLGLLSQLLAWVEDPSSHHAFWLSGVAGSGKTSVSGTFCTELTKRHLLGASFFCAVDSKDQNDVSLIFPSIAKTLSRAYPTFKKALAEALESDTTGRQNPLTMSLEKQYKLLILGPGTVAFHTRHMPITLCVDAVDECSDRDAVKDFLEAILKNRPTFPLKVFFTSRPEESIRRQLNSPSSTPLRQALRLQDIDRSAVCADIELYINRELGNIEELRAAYGNRLPPTKVRKIIERAGTLFIVAATMIRDIDDESGDPVERFEGYGSDDGSVLEDVHKLYQTILENVFQRLRVKEKENLHACLSLLVVSLRPLTVEQYAGLLGRNPSSIRMSFRSLHSVVKVPADDEPTLPISIYHASFVDFLLAQKIQQSRLLEDELPWLVKRQTAHSMIAKCCITLMDDEKKGVYFGISGAVTSYQSNEDQPSKLSIRSDLAYACTSWGDHALGSKPLSGDLQQRIEGFIKAKWPSWIEALSVEQDTRYARILWEVSKEVAPDELKALLTRISNFGRMFARPISLSAPHLYLSALPFCDAAMGSSDWILPKFPMAPIVSSTGLAKASRSCKVLSGPSPVSSMATSPNGNTVVTGCDDGFVRVWDVWTGELCLGLKGHTGEVTSVDFSPDGRRIVSGSYDGTIRAWDVATGEMVLEILGENTGEVISVCFSKDGTGIVSGLDDGTIGVWDAATGQTAPGPLKRLDSPFHFVGFSRGGERIVSGSADNQIRVRSARTGDVVLGPLEGHTDCVSCVAFSPDEKKIVSGSVDKTVRLWNAETGDIIASPLLRDQDDGTSQGVERAEAEVIATTTFRGDTPDGVRGIWDLENTQMESGPPQARIGSVCCARFSPDGTRVVSGLSDKTLGVWDMETGDRVIGPLRGHTRGVLSVDFSPGWEGGLCLAPRPPAAIEIWDGDTGDKVRNLGPLNRSLAGSTSLSFSPCGRRIASGSDRDTITVWDTETGTVLSHLKEPGRGVVAVCFAPDGKKIVSSSMDGTIGVWDAQTGNMISGPLEGHTDAVDSVSCSQDGRFIASGSRDRTVRIWDAETGEAVLGPLVRHTGGVNSVHFSPDSKRVVSGSEDGTIRIWNVQRAQPALSRPIFLHHYSATDLIMHDDGWVRNSSGDLLLWIPPQFRPSLYTPSTERIIVGPQTTVELTHALHHGSDWLRCMEPRSDKPLDSLPWPTSTRTAEGSPV
ncbi:hypothetical protein NMY22_g17279 [Coprinellus aureogranulatus]|nr:hypothetical protein NMY22_g17279 [Coprinellus aureogranulatus]